MESPSRRPCPIPEKTLDIKKAFSIIEPRAILHEPDVEHLASEHYSTLNAADRVFVLRTVEKGDTIYAEIKEPPGWILAQSGEKKFMELLSDDAQTSFAEEGGRSSGASKQDNSGLCAHPLNFFGFLLGLNSPQEDAVLESEDKRLFLEAFSDVKTKSKKKDRPGKKEDVLTKLHTI